MRPEAKTVSYMFGRISYLFKRIDFFFFGWIRLYSDDLVTCSDELGYLRQTCYCLDVLVICTDEYVICSSVLSYFFNE